MSRSSPSLLAPLFGLSLSLGAVVSGCVLAFPIGSVPGAEEEERPASEASRLVDFLFVVDNSSSMCDNQEALVRAFFDADCPIQDLDQVPLALQNPAPELAEELSEQCGFAQLMAAYDLDFRVGVISTDVGPCDDRFNIAETAGFPVCGLAPGWGRRPQRGCLQAPSSFGSRFLSRGDSAIGSKFASLIASVGVYGSAFERGLDAVDVFLDEDSEKEPSCANDAASFLRPDAHLTLVFVSDEDDCSHQDGAFGFGDENAGESCTHEIEEFKQLSPTACYDRPELLAPVEDFIQRWRARKGDKLSAILLGGLVPGDDAALVAGGCLTLDDGGIGGECFESGGNSNQTGTGGVCDPSMREQPCCIADGAGRYLQAVNALGARGVAGSICGGDFRDLLKQAVAVLR